ncbi:uracil-DNA glycosylase [Burkholderia stabilis]|uniref:Type-4 uracil-DNA glycosylase n=2 Tax=Burkholderia stabilis TaxID=95485 RepID=A0A1Y1BDY3_9BURK|nr:uracil-DNA glycosylase [Burkholderia stabilis]
MGLAQIWVRRGQRADEGAAADAPAVAQTGAADDASAVAADRPARALRAPAQDDAPPAVVRTAEASPARESGVPARRVVDGDRALAPAAPADAMPPMDDAPPPGEDDFAWFDAAPPGEPVPAAESRPAETPVAMLDWDALAARVSDCTRCRLCEKRTNTVFGVGDREADWMLIGEAPGENEDKQGEPFVGQAGKLLDNMLQSLALKRGDNVYIANVIKCRPPGNRNPEPDEVASCEPYLQRQVALVKPKLIVALGRFAAQTLLKTDASIASLRGRVHAYEGVPVIVTYHPAYLLRSLQDKSKAWADLCLARDTFQRAEGRDANGSAGQ